MVILGAAWKASADAYELARLVTLTIQRMGITRGEIAFYSGLSEKEQSDAFNCKKPLNVFRLADIPNFLKTFMLVLVEEYGYVAYPSESVRLIVQVMESPRPMLKASWPARKKEIA